MLYVPIQLVGGQIQHPTKSVFYWEVAGLSVEQLHCLCLVLGGTCSAWRLTAAVEAPIALSVLWTKYCSTRCPIAPCACCGDTSARLQRTKPHTTTPDNEGHMPLDHGLLVLLSQTLPIWGALLFLFQDKVCSQGWLPPRLTGYIS